MSSCIPESDLQAYLAGTLDDTRAAAVGEHLDQCDACNQAWEKLQIESPDDAIAGFALRTPPPEIRAAIARIGDRFQPGDYFGNYVIIEKLGSGGQGDVWAAWNMEEERHQALKFMLLPAPAPQPHDPNATAEQLAAPPKLVAELREAVRMELPNFIAIHGLGRVGDEFFIAMQLAAGGDLSKWKKRVDIAQVVRWLIPVADSIADANRHGLGHLDIKPHNILLVNPTTPKPGDVTRPTVPPAGNAARLSARLADFGLAPYVSGGTLPKGSNGFAAPEQRDPEWDVFRADLARRVAAIDGFGLAATLCWFLTDISPGAAKGRVTSPPTILRLMKAGLDVNLAAVLAKQLALDPRNRYESVQAFATDLRRWLDGEAVAARNYRGGVRKAVARQPWWVKAGAVALLVAVAAGVWYWDDGRAKARNAETAKRIAVNEERLAAAARLGSHREVLYLTDELEKDGVTITPRMRLYKVEALAGVSDTAALRDEVMRVPLDDLPAEFRGRFELWRAATLFGEDDARAEQYLRAALAYDLPPAEREYAEGLRAPTTPAAVEHFQRAIGHDYLYQPARSDACLLLLTLGRLDEAIALAEQSAGLFKDRPDFPTITAMAYGWKGDTARATQALAPLGRFGSLSAAEIETIRASPRMLALAGRMLRAEAGYDPPDVDREKLIEELIELVRKLNPGDIGSVPPRLGARLLGHLPPAQRARLRPHTVLLDGRPVLENWLDGVGPPEELLRLTDAHPEGYLLLATALAFFNRAEGGGINPNDNGEKYQALVTAANVALRAADTPGITPTRDIALDLAISLNALLGSPKKFGPRAEPVAARLAGVLLRRRLAEYGQVPVARCDMMVKAARVAGDFTIARRILDDWERRAPDDLDAARQRAEVEFQMGSYPPALRAAERVLTQHPADPDMLALRNAARARFIPLPVAPPPRPK